MADLPKRLQTTRGKINPLEVDLDDSLNGRAYAMDDERIRNMAISLIANGQEQPIRIRRTHGTGEDARYTVISGFTRTKAARLINADPELRAQAEANGRMKPGEVFPLMAIVTTVNEKEALWHNVVENLHRNHTSVIDDVTNQRRLREMGYSEDEIAGLYQCSTAWLSRLEGLLLLDDKHKRMVHEKGLSVTAAIALLEIPPNERDAVLAETDGKISKIKDLSRKNGKVIGRSRSQVVKFLKNAQAGEYRNPHTQTVLVTFYQFVSGEIDEESLLDRIDV